MRFRKNIGGILKVRPGHLANFSGGAGYMPFIMFLSVPASVLFGTIASLILAGKGKDLLSNDNGHKTGLHDFIQYAWRHTLVCFFLSVLGGGLLFILGNACVYGNKFQYALVTAVFAFGPLAAWLLSMLLLIKLIIWRGPQWNNLVLAALAHAGFLGACIPLLMLISAITGARV